MLQLVQRVVTHLLQQDLELVRQAEVAPVAGTQAAAEELVLGLTMEGVRVAAAAEALLTVLAQEEQVVIRGMVVLETAVVDQVERQVLEAEAEAVVIMV
jgi:hypothetical protein